MLPCRAPGQDRGGNFRSFWGSPELALDRHQGRVRVSQEKRRCCSIFEHRLIHLKEYQTAAGDMAPGKQDYGRPRKSGRTAVNSGRHDVLLRDDEKGRV